MKIIVDAFGGDNAPLEMIKGAKMAQQEYGVQVLLSGERNSIAACAKETDWISRTSRLSMLRE